MKQLSLLLILLLAVTGCKQEAPASKIPSVEPPVAAIEPHEIEAKHGHVRTDNYYWLKEREDQKVIDYLEAENAYLDTMMAHTNDFQSKLFEELKGRIKEDDSSVPSKIDDYYYYTRYVEGGEYGIRCRRKGSMDAEEEIIVDGNLLGEGKSFLRFYTQVSPDHKLAAIVMDTVGRNFFTIQFKNLETGKMLDDVISNVRGGVQWTNNNKSVVYTVPDPETLRNFQVKRHFLGQGADKDELIFQEDDQTLSVYVYKSRSKDYIMMSSGRTDASYTQYMDANDPGKPKLVNPIQDNVEYSVDHVGGDNFYIYTNLDAVNYRLVEAPINDSSQGKWTNVIAHRPDVFLQDVTYFKNYLALEEMREGLVNIRLIKWSDASEHEIAFDESAYYAGIGSNPEFNTDIIRYSYTSMTTPNSTFDYNMESKEKKLMKEREVLGDFDKSNYKTERVMVTARDGKKVPLSIVYRKDKFQKDGSNPGWIYSYGSYGSSSYAYFSSNRLSLLDRGFVYAIAHIRGGQEMGGEWYEDGKMMNKKNTFTDFIDCSKWLIENKYVADSKLFASGGSAGGLLMGAITNMAPELYKGVIAAVPFVDVVTTMMDETIPLTTFEWLEWGNPNIQEQYEYMLSYSPYDNVEAKAYPNLMVTTGLHDSQVQYWEPAKWVAKLRANKTDDNQLFLHTNMEAGHGGASGRFEWLKEVAMEYAFALDLVDINE